MTMHIICRRLLRGIARAAVLAGALLFCAHAQAQSSDHAAVSSLRATGADGNALQFDRAFHRTAFSYSTAVPFAVDSVKVTAVSDGAGVTMAIGAMALTDNTESAAIPLAEGANELLLVATAQDRAATTTYRLSITRAAGEATTNNARLASLRFDYGELGGAFAPATAGYTAALPKSLSRVIAVPEDAGATIMLSGSAVNNATVALASGVPSEVLEVPDSGTSMLIVDVTASDGAASMRYEVAITRKDGDVATLNALHIFSCERHASQPAFCSSTGITEVTPTFHPPFSPDDPDSLDYTVILPSGTRTANAFTVVLTHFHAHEDVLILSDVASNIVSEDGGISRPIDFSSTPKDVGLVVTAEDGATTLSYTLSIRIAAAAKTALTITAMNAEKAFGTADPALRYTANFAAGDTQAGVFSATPFVRAPGEDAGDYTFELADPLPFASAAAAAKYTVSLAAGGDFTITKHQIDHASTGADKIYDGNSHPPADFSVPLGALGPLMLGGVLIDDTTPGRLRLRGCAFADADAGDDKAITGCALAGAASGNYMLNANISGDITAKTVSAAAVTLTKPYDAGTVLAGAVLSGGAVSGAVLGESLALALVENPDDVFVSADAGGGIAVTMTGAPDFVLQSGDGGATKPANYELLGAATIDVTGVITPKEVTVDPVVLTKIYDGDDTFGASMIKSGSGGVSGEAGREMLQLSASGGIYSDADAGAGKTVTSPMLALESADNSANLANYALPESITVTGEITPKEVAVAPVVLTKAYDGDDTFGASVIESGGAVSGELDGEALRLTASGPATYENADAGAGKSVGGVVFALASDDATKPENYKLPAGIKVTGEITAKRVTATAVADTAAKTYDAGVAAPPGIAATFAAGNIEPVDDGKVGVDFDDYNSANVADAASITISLTGDSADNYELTATTVAAVITKRNLRVAANNVVVADDADRPAAADLTVRVDDPGGEREASGDAAAGAFVAAVSTRRNLHVTAKNVVVADDADRPAAANLAVRFAYAAGEGYAPGEGAAEAFTGALAYGATADDSAPIGRGDLAATGNYEIASFIAGVLTIGIIFDADGSDGADATDGVLIVRYLLGLRGDALIAGIKDDLKPGEDAGSIAATLKAAVEATDSKYDVDRSGGGANAADGIMIARYLLGVTEGDDLTDGQTEMPAEMVAQNIADTLP